MTISNQESLRELLNVMQMMRGYPHSWCVGGGWAIDLFVGCVSRSHKDIDIAIWRQDQLVLRSFLVAQGWSVEKAFEGELFPWENNEFLELPIHGVWCRNPDSQPDFLEILLNESNGQNFLFRRDPSITYPLERVIVMSNLGIPVLAPEIVLLYKAKNSSRAENQSDFETVISYLNCDRRNWLRKSLKKIHPSHHWLQDLEE